MSEKLHLLGVPRAELEELAVSFREPKYRATQVFKALHQRRRLSFDEITDLPKKLRAKLEETADISRLTVESKYVSTDGTRRYLMKTHDGYPVETVYIPTESRDTICFSSQSGCPLKCDFCLTAKLGLLRNLTVGEIIEQIIIVLNDVYGVGVETPHGTNLVGMGAGEPFLNFDNLIAALRMMSDEDGLFIVPNRVTISTARHRAAHFTILPARPAPPRDLFVVCERRASRTPDADQQKMGSRRADDCGKGI